MNPIIMKSLGQYRRHISLNFPRYHCELIIRPTFLAYQIFYFRSKIKCQKVGLYLSKFMTIFSDYLLATFSINF
jgi:hypothetical protein